MCSQIKVHVNNNKNTLAFDIQHTGVVMQPNYGFIYSILMPPSVIRSARNRICPSHLDFKEVRCFFIPERKISQSTYLLNREPPRSEHSFFMHLHLRDSLLPFPHHDHKLDRKHF
jgi:hypothetical protein